MAEDFVGEIRMFAVPPGGGGWLPCDGRSLPIQNPYLSLYSLILTTYGGDGKTFFKLPDLRGRAVIGCGPSASNALGTQGGTEMVALAATQLPGHTHNVRFSRSIGSAPTPKGSLPAESVPVSGEEVLLYGVPGENPATTTLDPDTVASTGGGAPHSNLQPSMVIYYYIAYLGFYPRRPTEEDQGEGGKALLAPEATAPLGRKVRKPTSSAVDAYTGEVRVFAGQISSIPVGWVLCNGAELKIANATQLFSLIGTVFGGNGVSAFRVPDLRGRVAVGLGNGPGLTPRPTIGETFGAMSVQLTAAQMPEHSHAFNVLTAPATLAAPTLGAMYAASHEYLLYQGPSTSPVVKVAFASGAVTNSDRESGLHDNMMPSLAMNYMICVQGIYPAQDEQPWVNAVVPASGPPVPPGDEDGTGAAESTLQVTLYGNALSGGVSLPAAGAAPTVTFGTVAATVLSYSDTSIVVQCPPGNGTVTVEVTTPRGVSRANAGSQFSYVPSVTGLFPPAGSPAGGSAVTIKGIGLSGASAVLFGRLPAVGFEVLDDRTILATTPLQGGSVTSVNVTVTVNGQTSAATATNVFSITSLFIELTPGFGPATGGNSVTVTGTNFSPSSGRVWFGDVMADSWTVVSATTIEAVAPPGVGVVDVTVENSASGTRSPPARYSYVAIVSGFSPTYGPSTGGTVVTIQGKNFDPASTVYFGSTAVTPTQTTPTQITVTTPSGRVTARLSVMGPGGASVGSHELPLFSYLPQLDSLSPAVGAPTGDPAVTLIGGNFTSDAVVHFGVTPATITALSTTYIVVTPPNGVAGTAVDVTVTTGGGQSSALRYTYCTVGVTGLQPPAGPAGTSVQITGEGFGTNPSVAFGGVAATGVSVNSAGTLIVCTAPAGEGVVNVSVTASGATSPAVEASRYSYAPVLTALSISTGKTWTSVTLTGEGFIAQSPSEEQMAVMFGALSAWQVQPSTTTSVTVWAPATLGRVPVVVMTPGGRSNALEFTYVPAVLSITPSYGTQGTVVRIVGAGLSVDGQPLDVQSVTFGLTPALNVWTQGTDEVLAEVPAGAGTVPVIVKTAGGSTANWSGALFHYAPIVTSVVPSSGASAGGTPLKITGSGFTGATAVTFDGVPGLYLNVPNDNELTVTTPPGTGEVPVIVRLPQAASARHEGATFTYGPVVESLDPNSLSVKQTGRVWITGKGLGRILSIDFCGIRYGAETYGTLWAHGELDGVRTVYLEATRPKRGAGTYDVTVTTPEGTSMPVSFSWTT